jgi:transcriptional regulator with PAS, ATPase and Fis domain
MANSNSNVVIIGESGTGKEMIAQGIHNAGSSAQGPFVAINCAAIPYNLIESEFFGYEPGTFTGGLQKGKPGKLELVRGGTLFLDEINGMSIDMQAKLLRVLEEKKFQRLGSNKYVPLEARVVSATNQDLLEQVKHGTFRHDLYYRLSVVEIHIPPLRMRMKDIEILVQCFIEEKNRQLGRSIKGISKEAMEYLMSYHWPGNIRELRNWIERAINLVHGNILSVQDFPTPTKCIDIQRVSQFLDLKGREKEVSRLGLMEYNTIRTVLEDCKGNISQASKRLGISRSTLYRKMRKYGIVVSLNVQS